MKFYKNNLSLAIGTYQELKLSFENMLQNVHYTIDQLKTKSSVFDDRYIYKVIVATLSDTTVGRIALFLNPNIKIEGKLTMCFGCYECIDSPSTSSAIFEEAYKIAHALKVTYILGPMNGTTWFDYRYAENYTHLFAGEIYHHPYYTNHLKAEGFLMQLTYISNLDDSLLRTKNRFKQYVDDTLIHSITIRQINIGKLNCELKNIYKLTMSAFKEAPLFSPIEEAVFVEKYHKLISTMDPRYILISEDKEKNLIGYLLSYPDPYAFPTKRLIVKTNAKTPYSHFGLGSYQLIKIIEVALENEFTEMVHAFMYEENLSNIKSSRHVNICKNKYHLFTKSITCL
jgi:hypothetical protein